MELRGKIYSTAHTVIVWLGEATTATDQTMEFLMKDEKSDNFSDGRLCVPRFFIPKGYLRRDLIRKHDPRLKEGLHEMFSRPWFQRLWILQEAYLARNLVVCCGSGAVSAETFVSACKRCLENIDAALLQVLNLMTESRAIKQAAKFSLHDVLVRFRNARATDPRDKVYGLLRLIDDADEKRRILPDYTLSEKQLMCRVFAALCFCEESCVPELPYDTIDDFLLNIDPIHNNILCQVLERSQEIDLERLLKQGSHYLNINKTLVEAAGRNQTKGKEMVKLLNDFVGYERPSSPAPSESGSVFSDVSAPSTNTSSAPEELQISVWHAAEILLSQDAFADLCRSGFHHRDMEPRQFTKNLRLSLEAFGKKVLDESPNYSARIAGQLIIGGSRRMAALIRTRYDQSYGREGLISNNINNLTEAERRALINNYIDQTLAAARESSQSREIIEIDSDSDQGADADASEVVEGVSSLDQIEKFILSSRAFESLLDSLKFLLQNLEHREGGLPAMATSEVVLHATPEIHVRTDSEEPLVSIPQEPSTETISKRHGGSESWRFPFLSSAYEILSSLLTTMEKLEAGLHRIQYTCSCGERMFVDVKELRPGGLERFRVQLTASMKESYLHTLGGSGANPSAMPAIPQKAHITSGSSSGSSRPSTTIGGTSLNPGSPPGNPQTGSGAQQQLQAGSGDPMPRFLLLCVNTRNLAKLLHVDLRYTQNDQLLFDMIRRRYWEARRNESWHFGLFLPKWLTHHVPVAWKDWLETVHLRIPRSAELIQFRLVPFPVRICPDKVRLGLPPEHEVKIQRNYHYDPCPTDVAVLSIPKFWHLLKPGVHSHTFWLNTFPKKLRDELPYQPAAIGWGLMIHEGWDWVVLLFQILALSTITGIAVTLYTVVTHDRSSAFGLGAYGMAIITLLFTVKYYAWQESEGS